MSGYRPDRRVEMLAARLLARFESDNGPIIAPPVPVERVVEESLGLNILWDTIEEEPGVTVLAALAPRHQTVVFNDPRRSVVIDTPGLYSTILAHEAGHWEAHVDPALFSQPALPGLEAPYACFFRSDATPSDPREREAHRFMSCLLMPEGLLKDAAATSGSLTWPDLYRLRDTFDVTITALNIRLEQLGLNYVAPDRTLHRSRAEFQGQRRLGA